MLKNEFYTILGQTEIRFEEKKSIFICNISHVSNEDEAVQFINKIKEKYSDATHNVSAYITNNCLSMRYSDDGEPKGTAGMPALEVLKLQKLCNVSAVVTRYFGGILLGAGGLIRAYSRACREAAQKSVKVFESNGKKAVLCFDYSLYGKINNYIQVKKIVHDKPEFLEKIKLQIYCTDDDIKLIRKDIIEMTNGEDIFINTEDIICFLDENYKIVEVV